MIDAQLTLRFALLSPEAPGLGAVELVFGGDSFDLSARTRAGHRGQAPQQPVVLQQRRRGQRPIKTMKMLPCQREQRSIGEIPPARWTT